MQKGNCTIRARIQGGRVRLRERTLAVSNKPTVIQDKILRYIEHDMRTYLVGVYLLILIQEVALY